LQVDDCELQRRFANKRHLGGGGFAASAEQLAEKLRKRDWYRRLKPTRNRNKGLRTPA
jgi:hypothetical protein